MVAIHPLTLLVVWRAIESARKAIRHYSNSVCLRSVYSRMAPSGQ